MKTASLAVIVLSCALGACMDKPTEQAAKTSDPASPALTTAAKPVMNGASSSVCKAYQKELAAVSAQYAQSPTADLQDTKGALEVITSDVCN